MKNNNIEPILKIENITKRFPGVLANDRICLDLYPQEIHCLLGENGAGKSTLMNIIYGLYTQDEGIIYVKGIEVEIKNPIDALRLGIGMVHQHFMLIPVMTVTENLMLGQEKTTGLKLGKLSKLDRSTVSAELQELASKYGLSVNPNAYIEDLSVGEEQRVEILKVLYKGAEILILDEPTAVLTPQETDEFFNILKLLVKQGKSIIFITHKLKEVLEIADRITVLRNGKTVGTTTPKETSMHKLAEMMVGREVLLNIEKGQPKPKEKVFEVSDLSVMDNRKINVVNGVSFFIRAGEIYGIAGVQGNGQKELVEALTGLRKAARGNVKLLGNDVTNEDARSLTLTGIAHVPEDRQKHGLVMGFSIDLNLILQTYFQSPFSNLGFINLDSIHENANQLVKKFDIRTPSIFTPVMSLSGGNQQKVIIARELNRPIQLLIVNQPTRGLDVGSIEFIHQQIIVARDKGVAVLLVSAELDEILSLSDRIGVMFNGKIVTEMNTSEADRAKLGFYMAGFSDEKMFHKE
ncbi:MAG: heme ABC transporter ATP-binding protein [Chloroflexi bacterium HGW-Chloroflexi-3]|nr:MAG: heme ABC transporter ATP-binding protein [Chloroflexi bacterium HGW-Chloroflexi-3]